MKHIKLSRLSDRQLRRLLNRAEVRFAYPPNEKRDVGLMWYWLYDTDPKKSEWKRGPKKGNAWAVFGNRVGTTEVKAMLQKIQNWQMWEKVTDPRFAEIVIKRESDGKGFYYRRKGFQWDRTGVTPANSNWIDSMPHPILNNEKTLRPMTLSKRKVRFGDWRDEERKKYYSEIDKALTDYYDDVQWYMNGNGFSGLKANVQRLQKYNPKMAKACEKLMKDFDERRKKLLTIIKPYIDEIKKRIRERG